jgi:serine/threonine protein kinase
MEPGADRFGTRYDIKTLLGKGGMGEVYRAHDRRLRRDVALKILPNDFAQDPQRVTLFMREAHVIASLNHSNIAAIYELEESPNLRWLVLELVEGTTLAERLSRGPLAVREALSIAKQVCEGLEAAHEKGVIHRDLKPSNIKITPDDKVKLLDFGIATAFEANPSTTEGASTPTMRTPSSLPPHCGTAAYMAPEQFQWKVINKQVDIWSFGCVMFEMLTGQAPFQANTLREMATLIIDTDPDWTLLSYVPPRVLNLIQRCLQKDRRARFHDIADARLEIEQLLTDLTASKDMDTGVRPNSRRQWWLAGLGLAAGIFLGAILLRTTPANLPAPAVRFSIPVAQTNSIAQIAISPHGRRIAYVAGNAKGNRVIWVRNLDDASSRALAGPEDPIGPFWSPNDDMIGFFSDAQLRVVDAFGGNIKTIALAFGSTTGTWSKSGEILIDANEGSGLFRVSVDSGVLTRLTSPDTLKGEKHFQPQFLPDGQRFLYLKRTADSKTSGLYLGSLNSPKSEFVMNTTSKAMFSAPSDLFFLRDGVLLAQEVQFNPPKLIGDPVRIADQISASAISGSAAFGVSNNRVVGYRSGSAFQNARLPWLDRDGKELAVVGEPAVYTQIALAPDEKHAALERRNPTTGSYDIWLADLTRNSSTRLTFEESSERNPIWMPDSRSIVYSSDRLGLQALYLQGIETTGAAELVLKGNEPYRAMDVTASNVLLVRTDGQSFFTFPLRGGQQPTSWLQSSFAKFDARLSPNGRWVAYTATDSGRNDVYVVSFPKADRKKQISTSGGVQPVWNGDGTELFYLDLAGQMTAVKVREEANGLILGIPKVLFRFRSSSPGLPQYVVNRQGTQFLVIENVRDEQFTPIEVIVNWSGR